MLGKITCPRSDLENLLESAMPGDSFENLLSVGDTWEGIPWLNDSWESGLPDLMSCLTPNDPDAVMAAGAASSSNPPKAVGLMSCLTPNDPGAVMAAGAASSSYPPKAVGPLAVAMEGVQSEPCNSRLQPGSSTHATSPPTTGMDGLQRTTLARFLTSTYDMVDDSSTDSVVSWGNNNDSFVVWSPEDFVRWLPTRFKHNNWASFVRQLNTYKFRKVHTDRLEFANDWFLKGKRHLLKNICRRVPQSQSKPLQEQHQHISQQTQTSSIWPYVGVEEEVDQLKRDNNILMLELARLRQQNEAQENDLQVMGQLVRNLEASQIKHQQMMRFLAKTMRDPILIAQLVQSCENY